MKNKNILTRAFAQLISTIVILIPVSSMGLNYNGPGDGAGHTQMIKDVIQIIKENENAYQSVTGNDVRDTFNLKLSQTREKLAELQCGLDNPYTTGRFEYYCYPEYEHNARYEEWQQRAADPEDPVYSITFYQIRYINRASPPDAEYCYVVKYDMVGTCGYIEDTNFNNFDKVLIKDMRYFGLQRNNSVDNCFMSYDAEAKEEDFISLDEVLARYAGKVDDEINDTVLWSKPCNTKSGEIRDQMHQAAVDAAMTPAKVLVAAFYCVVQWFMGDSCDWEDAMEVFPDVDVGRITGAMPGAGSFTNSMFVGLWHMMQVDYDGQGEYNELPGTLLENAGPGGKPGVLDLAVMTIADITGGSLRYGEAQGVHRYGSHDEDRRTVGEWQSENIGHLEFSPLDKLAEYGWKKFVDNPVTAKYLGWPLHALGDTVVPHHLTGTMSHGHQPFENAAGIVYSKLTSGAEEEILEKGFEWWQRYCYNKEMTSIADMVIKVAKENRQMVTGTWAWKDISSVDYTLVDFSDLSGLMGTKDEIVLEAYLSNADAFAAHVRPLFINSSGAALATLMCASELVEPPGRSPDTKCPGDTIYCPTYEANFGCIEESQCNIKKHPEELDTDVEIVTEKDPIIVI